jgi:hypothetical protein
MKFNRFFSIFVGGALLSGCVTHPWSPGLNRPVYQVACIGGAYLAGCVAHPSLQDHLKRPTYQVPQPKPARKLLAVRVRPSEPAKVPQRAEDVSALSASSLPFSKEWYDREEEIDQRLRRIMIICRGC